MSDFEALDEVVSDCQAIEVVDRCSGTQPQPLNRRCRIYSDFQFLLAH